MSLFMKKPMSHLLADAADSETTGIVNTSEAGSGAADTREVGLTAPVTGVANPAGVGTPIPDSTFLNSAVPGIKVPALDATGPDVDAPVV